MSNQTKHKDLTTHLNLSQVSYRKRLYFAVTLIKAGMEARRYIARHLVVRLGLDVRYPERYRVITDSDHIEAINMPVRNTGCT